MANQMIFKYTKIMPRSIYWQLYFSYIFLTFFALKLRLNAVGGNIGVT